MTVAKDIELKDKFQNMGTQMVREVASKANDVAGDGTTTALFGAMHCQEGAKAVASGMNPMDLKRGIDMAVEAVVGSLVSRSKKISTSDEGASWHNLRKRRRRNRQDDCRGDGAVAMKV